MVDNTNNLCFKHGYIHEEIKRLRYFALQDFRKTFSKAVVNGCLELQETKYKAKNNLNKIEVLESSISAMGDSLSTGAGTLEKKSDMLSEAKCKLSSTLSSIKVLQRNLNKMLMRQSDIEEVRNPEVVCNITH